MNGIINYLKPPGISSARAINRIKKRWKWKKVGHVGTLDPMAAGVLPLCVGKATKVASFLLLEDKTYWGEICLGQERDSDDAYGRVLKESPVDCSPFEVQKELKKFQGWIAQNPPRVSAIKIKGERAYRLSRRGEDFKIPSRQVQVLALHPLEIKLPRVRFWIHCSRGTYIRSIARDLGQALGTGGYLNFLIRTSTGPFCLKDTISQEEMEEKNPDEFLQPPDLALQHLPFLIADEGGREKVRFGQTLTPEDLLNPSGESADYFRLYDQDHNFLALCRPEENGYHPFKVFI